MKRSHKLVLTALKAGAIIWCPQRSKTAWVCCGDEVPVRLQVRTLHEMNRLGLIDLVQPNKNSTDIEAQLPGSWLK